MAKTEQTRSGVEPTRETDRVALHRVGHRWGQPLPPRIPNADTIAALCEPVDKLKQFASVYDLFADIEGGLGGEHYGRTNA